MARRALVHVNTAGSDVGGVVGPAWVTHAAGLHTVSLAEGVGATLDTLTRRFTNSLGRVAHEAEVTSTLVAAGNILALGVGATGGELALVHVPALGTHSLEAIAAEALTLYALSVIHTVEVGPTQDVYVRLLTGDVGRGAGTEPLGTQAGEARLCVLADGIDATRAVVGGTLVDIHTACVGVSRIVL